MEFRSRRNVFTTPAARLVRPPNAYLTLLQDIAMPRELFFCARSKAHELSECLSVLLDGMVPNVSDGNIFRGVYITQNLLSPFL